ncbi:50S ribosomal protein L19 [Candidatus Peregrinibacteria bacterium CG10_big_fil_rev_8_21_14_0_10_49_16]|nr:MAG: 50S ribosomal protein L19 [Candidatus Peregrinibacteria bacterium CG22_combo_CG10-13_8_21_14_all_49_11]PIR51725.1 MAG: 50S ribosomal protein L19 [Candidatus Peregrinibacteria bacterium CG10_big_fil_rev_8_21_14_0_10_49_16]
MTHQLLQSQARSALRPVPDLKPGYTVRVRERIQEGSKERIQTFEGLVIQVHRGHVPTDATVTLRRLVSGVWVEKVYPLQSPVIASMEVKKVAKVRRAKLFFLRTAFGKRSKLTERFMTKEEVEAMNVQEKEEEKDGEEVLADNQPVAEKTEQKA